MLLAVLPTMHLGWGFGTLAGMARFGPPIAAIRRVLGLGAPPLPKDDGAVHAPSLHERGG